MAFKRLNITEETYNELRTLQYLEARPLYQIAEEALECYFVKKYAEHAAQEQK